MTMQSSSQLPVANDHARSPSRQLPSAAKTDKEKFVNAHSQTPTAKTIDPSTELRYPHAGDGSWITEKSTCTQ